jgi:hypothetical protein
MLFILILIASLLFQLFLPWWIIAPVAFILAAWKANTAGGAYKAGFGAIFILWIAMSLLQTLPNENILANRVGLMLGFPDIPFRWIFVLLITGIAGGLASGFSAFAGYYCRQAISK